MMPGGSYNQVFILGGDLSSQQEEIVRIYLLQVL
jgi:hypothetical protein